MDIISWVPITLLTGIFIYFGILIGSQKERLLASKEEIYEAMKFDIYQKNTVNLKVVAGEANIEIYNILCKIVRKNLEQGTLNKASFTLGPTVSTWEDVKKHLDSDRKLEDKSRNTNILKMAHPIFALFLDFPNNISLYYKNENSEIDQESHFAITDTLIYNEKPHKPLEETEGIIIEHPNFFMRKKYNRRLSQIKSNPNTVELKTKENIWNNVKFGHFQIDNKSRNENA